MSGQPGGLLDLETHFRNALIETGGRLFAPLLQERVDQIDRAYSPKPGYQFIGRRSLGVDTLFGEVRLVRDYYLGPTEGHCPADAALGLEGSATPALARVVCRAAAQQPFGAASRDLAEYGAIQVDERQIQRLVRRIAPDVEPWLESLPQPSVVTPTLYVCCDGTGTPMRKDELRGRKGKQSDGTAKTREVKLGAVFTQHKTDEEGFPVRDHESTTYVGSYRSASEFALLLRQEARRRSVGSAQQVIFLSDGAAWAEGIGENCFATAVSILDFYHACERIHELAEALGQEQAQKRTARWKKRLLKDQVAEVIVEAETIASDALIQSSIVDDNLGFLKRHQQRMMYGTYRENGWFIGSGVIEAGCRTVVGKRLKQSGMFWSEKGATCVLNLRTILLSQRFDLFWKHRANAYAAQNDTLSLAV